MANHKSALKRIRQTAKRREYNRTYRTRARTFIKKARAAIKAAPATADTIEAVKAAVRDLDKAASRGVIHPRNAARRKSRLMKQLAAAQS
ncbi:MAG: 30S ribosomal protein S20 [Chloroflexi bacterium]|jgi:small subunit ribosomal protein S20|nr:MAG: 30S ribosomal protein S20 [Chloroflexi bacterium OLB13]MBC6954888.1 30S ribosomal protein S20 [Chloroflexota bacterium]MBV6437474.1 30S ribosomal protein S20 [Anaerolineae bacterium]MDL1914719.1 30S ribosomal protein S20 [Anaerolineae bacterium CFX4]MBW7879361.1 30S ribosomal protein S20 [Anaerolineae bacterium]